MNLLDGDVVISARISQGARMHAPDEYGTNKDFPERVPNKMYIYS